MSKKARPPCFLWVEWNHNYKQLYLLFSDHYSCVYPDVNPDDIANWLREEEPNGTFFNLAMRRPNRANLPFYRQWWYHDPLNTTIVDNR